MNINKVSAFYYSPTRTTQKIVRAIASGIGIDPLNITENDLTYPEFEESLIEVEPGDLVIIGAPVYCGQIAIEAHRRLEKIKFAGNPAVLVALYGNRHYDNALIDIREMALKLGLAPVAAAAFVGEHSYSTRDLPIAKGRPDKEDEMAARDFGSAVAKKIQGCKSLFEAALSEIPGVFPLPERIMVPDSYAQTAVNKCNECGVCQIVCPTGAISFKKGVQTDPTLCTMCCACIKACKRRARIVISEVVPISRERLAENCKDRKQPLTFL